MCDLKRYHLLSPGVEPNNPPPAGAAAAGAGAPKSPPPAGAGAAGANIKYTMIKVSTDDDERFTYFEINCIFSPGAPNRPPPVAGAGAGVPKSPPPAGAGAVFRKVKSSVSKSFTR